MVLLVLGFLLSACAALPATAPKVESRAIVDWDRTPLAELVAPALTTDGRSGFRLQPYGPNAFAARIALSKLATRSLDVQYFLLAADDTGMVLMRAVRDAAARGVRVRVLVDDFNTVGEDELLLALGSYPNVQVRLFNPFPAARWSTWSRFVAAATDFGRVNRRMHNKLFVADNVAAITGGRNIADEYAMNSSGSNFLDMDLFVAGPLVRDLSTAFDHYWNSEVVYDVASIVDSPLSAVQLQAEFERRTAQARPPATEPADGDRVIGRTGDESSALSSSARAAMLHLPAELDSGRLSPLVLAHGQVLFDPLDKMLAPSKQTDKRRTVTEDVVNWMHSARERVKMVSPYFVPDDDAIEEMTRARRNGLEMTLVTNSLASTDVPWAYFAYWRRVDTLLRAGVVVAEISPTFVARQHRPDVVRHPTDADRLSSLALHMKNVIVDDRQVFLGSMNLDQRSAKLNTELGVIVDSPELAQQIDRFVEATRWYQVRLGAAGAIEWVEHLGGGQQKVHNAPPETGVWRRVLLRLVAPLVSEGNL